MKKILVFIFILMLHFACKKTDDAKTIIESEICKNEISFEIEGNLKQYSSADSSVNLIGDFAYPIPNDTALIGDIGKLNVFNLEDSIYNKIKIYIHNMVIKDNETINSDSLIMANLNKNQFEYLSDLYSYNPSAVTIELIQKEPEQLWYSYKTDSMNFEINQETSYFNIESVCEDNNQLYKGTFSCNLYRESGEQIRIHNGNFWFGI